MKWDEQNSLGISTLLDRMSSQLDLLAGQVFDVEEAIGTSMTDGQNAHGVEITRLQALDYLRQCLEDLALLTTLLSREDENLSARIGNLNELSSKLKLEVTKGILAGERRPEESSLKRAVGDVDLF